jgi:hypothetical protein
LVGEIISKKERARREKIKKEREKKAKQLLEDIPMSDEQQKDALIMEWTEYAEKANTKNFE